MTPYTRWWSARLWRRRTLLTIGRVAYILGLVAGIVAIDCDQWKFAMVGLALFHAGLACDIRLAVIAYRSRTTEIIALWQEGISGPTGG